MERVFTMPEGRTLILKEDEQLKTKLRSMNVEKAVYAIIIDGKLHDLNYEPSIGGKLELVYADSEIGRMVYERSLAFVFIAAAQNLFGKGIVRMENAIANGQYCEVDRLPFLSLSDVDLIRKEMDRLIVLKTPIRRKVVSTAEAVDFFYAIGMESKAKLLACRSSEKSSIYELDGNYDYFYGIMLPDASYITHYALEYYAPGVWLSPYPKETEQHKLFEVFQRFEKWGKTIGVSNVAQLNEKILAGKMDELVLMGESMMEKELVELASRIVRERPQTQLILISGPSSAGKTTFSRRLSIHLKILGLEPFPISMDNFYKNREDTPRHADGSYDFECLEALDLKLFDEVMAKLLHHIPVKLPVFNFKSGLQETMEHETVLKENQVLIIEGIHGLNPEVSRHLPNTSVFKIYLNALTHLNLDEHNRIPTSDYRLIRRIVRDHQIRGWSAAQTISFWKSVRNGEDKYIYPYQESADAIFNTSMIYEMAVLKTLVTPLLDAIDKHSPQYLEANRLNKLVAYFAQGQTDAIPRYSILAEFVGNSILDVS